jgi:hypothetical protein
MSRAAQLLQHLDGLATRPFGDFLGLWQVGDAAGAVVRAGAGAPLGESDEAEDSGCEPFEFNDGGTGTCAPATRVEGGSREGPVCAAVSGDAGAAVVSADGGAVVLLGDGGSVVVLDGCFTGVSERWPLLTPGETSNTPAKTSTANAAAATTAVPMTTAATT